MAQLNAVLNCFQYPRIKSCALLDCKNEKMHKIKIRDGTGESMMSNLNLYAMNGGDGPNSYARNSSYQRGVVDIAKPILEEEIATRLNVENHSTTHGPTFRIADFGCSTGHNSFPAMQIITEAVEKQFQTQGSATHQVPNFQVMFNDQIMNDFNLLFRSLSPQRNYHAVGVPGPFHGRLLPDASIDFAYSSCALNWISKVPAAVENPSSPAWNQGRVHYTGARRDVYEAYSTHYANDIQRFLEARAHELVKGGLMALLVPAVPGYKLSETSYTTPSEIDLIGSCLVDMAEKGRVSEEKIDSFNFPLYFTAPHELKAIIDRNQKFSIKRMEILDNSPGKRTLMDAESRAAYLRAVFEGLLSNHFGSEMMEELFFRYAKKLEATPRFLDPSNEKSIIVFLLLQRKHSE